MPTMFASAGSSADPGAMFAAAAIEAEAAIAPSITGGRSLEAIQEVPAGIGLCVQSLLSDRMDALSTPLL